MEKIHAIVKIRNNQFYSFSLPLHLFLAFCLSSSVSSFCALYSTCYAGPTHMLCMRIHTLQARDYIWWRTFFFFLSEVCYSLSLYIQNAFIFLELCFHISLEMNNVPPYVCTIFSLSIHLLLITKLIQFPSILNEASIILAVPMESYGVLRVLA